MKEIFSPRPASRRFARRLLAGAAACLAVWGAQTARAEAILQLFNVSWADMARKMPEIAEAGYDAIWLPPPAKGSSVYSIGYDLFDPFDLGDVNQAGTTATHYGTKAELQELVRTAHRFGIRIYLDNIMNHRGFTVPGYDANTPTNFYPGLVPGDFHLQTAGSYYRNWPSVQDWGNQWDVQYQSLGGLIDLATEPGATNGNFGANPGGQAAKPNFIRHPGKNQYYMDMAKPAIEGSPWHPFNGTNGVPVAEDVNSCGIRAVLYTLDQTKCDGFRLDAVKHVPSGFFGDSTATFNGYCGAIQAMFDCVHGYGTNAAGNGYMEADDSRNSCFNSEAPRNDALLFGEHLGQPPTYGEYIASGMRLLNAPLRDQMNNALNGNASLSGYDQPGQGTIDPRQSVMFAQSHDASGSYAAHRELQNAFYLMHEGTAVIYSDGYNQSGPPNYFPSVAYANYLGEYNDNYMPDACYVHNQLARGYTNPRWSDQNIVAYERYDYREGGAPQDQVCALFVMNDKYTYPGDITFDDGVAQSTNGDFYGAAGIAVSNSKNVGLAVGFPPGSVLAQLASSSPTGGRAYPKLLVHGATTNLSAAQASANATNPQDRLIYVGGQAVPAGGGAVELNVPGGAWVCYGYQWPEASRANVSTNAIILQQGGSEVRHVTITRTDGANGDTNGFNPVYPFKMRGSVDAYGNVIGGVHVANLAYAIDIPVVTNGNFDILARCDASCVNTLIKLDGGVDLNSQMSLGPTNQNGKSSDGLAPTNFPDLRDNKPGYASDVFLGYEQTAFQFRNGPEKFAAKNTLSNTIVSLGAETYVYTVGGGSNIVSGSGYGQGINFSTCYFNYHDPLGANTASNAGTATQRVPLSPAAGQPADIYCQTGDTNMVSAVCIYYTTDGSNPEGAFGTGKGTTQVAPMVRAGRDLAAATKEWWKGTVPAQGGGTQVRYKIGAFNAGIGTISDAEPQGSKLYGLSQFAITNFNPNTAVVWQHNDLNTNSTVTGLQSGFHILRARSFLPRSGKSSVYNTFSQTFYYDGALPAGAIPYPAGGTAIGSTNYTVVVRCDSTVTGVDFNIQDGDPNNDDTATGRANGNGSSNGVPVYVAATAVAPDAGLGAQYPNYPQEFRFNYANVPTAGSATINVRLKELGTAVYPDRFTVLSATVSTLAPQQVVTIVNPATNGAILPYVTNSVYQLQAYFSPSLASANNNFTVKANGTLLPQAGYFLRPTNPASMNLKILYCNWTNPPAGASTIEVSFTNGLVPITDTRQAIFAPPLRISALDRHSQIVSWDSAPGVNYQVLATTNLLVPFAPISDPIPGAGLSTIFYDPDLAGQKFYQIQLMQ